MNRIYVAKQEKNKLGKSTKYNKNEGQELLFNLHIQVTAAGNKASNSCYCDLG